MRVKRYQNGGSDPIGRRLERERLAADRAGVIDEAMRQNIIPDPRVTGAISVDRPYIFDLMGAGELASLGARGVRALAGRGARSVADDAVSPLIKLQNKQADDRLQNLAERAIRERSREESQAALNLQQEAQKIIDDLNLAGRIDEIEYNALVDDVENLFNISPGGKASDFPEQFASALSEKLSKYGLEPESVVGKLVDSMDKRYLLNNKGGKMKVLHNKKPGMALSKRIR